MRSISFILLFFYSLGGIAQDTDTDLVFLQGHLHGGLPVQLTIHDQGEISGYVSYGSKQNLEYKIEGEKTSKGYTLYEVDEHQNITGVIELNEDHSQGVWNSIDYARNIPITFGSNEGVVVDHATHQSYAAVVIPEVDEGFQNRLTIKMGSVIRDIAESYGAKEIMTEQNSPNNRFENRTLAVHKITLDSEDLISGFVTFYDNQSSDVHTITYSYDRDKKEMLGLTKIFKKNFDYAFFLKQYIKQKKSQTAPLLSTLQSKWVKHSSFHHYVLTDTGLQFFNDYDPIFGRYNFTIPYYEISSSIGHKTINNYIKKRK